MPTAEELKHHLLKPMGSIVFPEQYVTVKDCYIEVKDDTNMTPVRLETIREIEIFRDGYALGWCEAY